jgi:hypothetical protein
LLVPETLPGTGWSGDKGERNVQALVPGSSEPSGQSQKSSLTAERGRMMEGVEMHWKVSFDL